MGETAIVFGAGRVGALASDLDALLKDRAHLFVIVDSGVVAAGCLDRVMRALTDSAHSLTCHQIPGGEPTAASVDAAVRRAGESGATAVIAVGGGSVLDTGKLVAALTPGGEAVASYALGGRTLPSVGLPLVGLPTTAGTGAEVTRTSTFALDEGAKVWAWGANLNPDLAILDPELTVSLPPALTVATGIDALVHAVEATTNRVQGPGIDLPAMAAITMVRRALPAALVRPADLSARGDLLRAACLAGQAVERAGTGVAHAFGHALGSMAPVAHGRAVGLSLRAALAWNAEAAPENHAAVADAFTADDPAAPCEPEPSPLSVAARGHALAVGFDSFLHDLGMPLDLDDVGLGAADAERVAEIVMRPENAPMRAANCRSLDPEDAVTLSRRLLGAA